MENIIIPHNEKWMLIKDHPNYLISNTGRIMSLSHKGSPDTKLLKPRVHKGYLQVNILGERLSVHRLVLSTFEPNNQMQNLQVNHKDLDKTNNNLDNLEWLTQEENVVHYWTSNKENKERRNKAIRQMYLTGKYTRKELAIKFKLSLDPINRALKGIKQPKLTKQLYQDLIAHGFTTKDISIRYGIRYYDLCTKVEKAGLEII